ncbi:MAG: VOC family protein [Anaerolineae bacterium]
MTTYSQPKLAGAPTWVDLATPDPDGARAFYHAIFGWNYDIGGPEYGGYTTAHVGQRTAAGMVGNVSPDGTVYPAAWGLSFASHDIAADAARAVELGAAVLYPAMVVGEFGSMAGFVDPGGAMFSFWQAGQHIGAEVTDEPGSATWYELYASNAKQSRDFYVALLGATADAMPGDLEYYVLKHGEAMLGGVMQIDPAWGDFHPNWTIYFAVADADETVALATGNGGKVLSAAEDTPFGRMATLTDPFGAVFKILQLPTQ